MHRIPTVCMCNKKHSTACNTTEQQQQSDLKLNSEKETENNVKCDFFNHLVVDWTARKARHFFTIESTLFIFLHAHHKS